MEKICVIEDDLIKEYFEDMSYSVYIVEDFINIE
jgi:hypothetical protein